MKKIETIKNVINAFTGMAAIGAWFAFSLHLGLWLIFIPFIAIFIFLYFAAATAFHFLRGVKSLKSYRTFFLLVTFIFDSLYLLWFFEGRSALTGDYQNLINQFTNVFFIIYAVMIVLSTALEILYSLESHRDIKEEKNKYTLWIKIADYAAACSICVTGVVNSYYYGYATHNYLLLILLVSLIVIVIVNSFSTYRKSRLEFTVTIFILYLVYLAAFIFVYLFIMFDDLPKGDEILLISSWASTFIFIPIVIIFNIIYLIKKNNENRGTIEQVS